MVLYNLTTTEGGLNALSTVIPSGDLTVAIKGPDGTILVLEVVNSCSSNPHIRQTTSPQDCFSGDLLVYTTDSQGKILSSISNLSTGCTSANDSNTTIVRSTNGTCSTLTAVTTANGETKAFDHKPNVSGAACACAPTTAPTTNMAVGGTGGTGKGGNVM